MKITIGHLFPDLLNLYGDRGNIYSLQRRCQWRGIDAQVIKFKADDNIDFKSLDIVFIGGGSDREQLLVTQKLMKVKENFREYIEDNGVTIAICGGYQLLGHYYKLENQTIKGLEILDIYTETEKERLTGNIIIKSDYLDKKSTIVGFENHGGRTYINNHTPLGKVVVGFGNNGKDGSEGVIYKNTIGTYLHGPLFPKNPNIVDHMLFRALEKKYGLKKEEFDKLELNDSLEYIAHNTIIDRLIPHRND